VLDTGVLCPILVLISYDKGKYNNLIAKYFIEEETYKNEIEDYLTNKSSDILDELALRYPELNFDNFSEFFNKLIEENSFEILSLNKEIHSLNLKSKNSLIYDELRKIYEKHRNLFEFSGNNKNVGEFRSYLLAILIDAEYFITWDYSCCSNIMEKFKVRARGGITSKGAVYPWRVGIIGLCDYMDIVVNDDDYYKYIEILKEYFEISKKYNKKLKNHHPEILLINKLHKKYGELLHHKS